MVSRPLRVHDLITRRQWLLLTLGLALLPGRILADSRQSGSIEWDAFLIKMRKLAADRIDQNMIGSDGIQLLQQLNIDSPAFKEAVNGAFETGNRYWLWQRMVKQDNVNGGILTIDKEQIVQLHDHPGATGMLRIINGEAEVWQFNLVSDATAANGDRIAVLNRVSYRVLKPGDTAILSPGYGNIHALRAVSRQCSMLDFFIPPYQRSKRTWYEPVDEDWVNHETISCRSIPQHEYTKA